MDSYTEGLKQAEIAKHLQLLKLFQQEITQMVFARLEGVVQAEARTLVDTIAGQEIRTMVRDAVKSRINIDILIDGQER